MAIVFIGIGSNLGDRLKNCHEAVKRLKGEAGIKLLVESKWRETEAIIPHQPTSTLRVEKNTLRVEVGKVEPSFINGVVKIETRLLPEDLLVTLQKIEVELGRVRTGKKWEPRTIDLDILFYDDLVIDTPTLKIPHPELHKRMFVLEPMCDIGPTFEHPVLGKTVRELLNIVRAYREQ